MEWTAGARKVAARRRKEEPEEQRLFLSPPGPHSQTINQTNRQEVGCAAAAATSLFSTRCLPPLNVYCCCFFFFFLCLFKYTLLYQLLWPSVSLNVWTFKSCFTTCNASTVISAISNFGSTELFNWLVLQAGLFSKQLRYWHGKQEKSHTSSMAELALELPSTFHSVFTQIWCFHRRLLPVFSLQNTFQRLCSLCVFLLVCILSRHRPSVGWNFSQLCCSGPKKQHDRDKDYPGKRQSLLSSSHLCLCDIATASL